MQEIFSKIQQAVIDLDEENLAKLTKDAIEAGVDPIQTIEEAYTVGIQKVGELFESGEYFLPELLFGAKIVKAAITEMQSRIPAGQTTSKGKVVIGTVEGDIHDIGKNLVITMLETRGIEVVDIGLDCPVDKFIDRAIEENADIVGASCLLTMTAPEQKKLVERMKERGVRDRFRLIVGGAAIDRGWAREIGADGFADNAKEAVDLALSLLGGKRSS